jgi:hypothetical protein
VKLNDPATAKREGRRLASLLVTRQIIRKTAEVHISRDVVWRRRMLFPKTVLGDDELVVVLPNIGHGNDVWVDISDDNTRESVIPGDQCEDSDTEEANESDVILDSDVEDQLETNQDIEDFRRELKTTTGSGRNIYSPQRLIASALIPTTRAQDNLERNLRNLLELSLAIYLHRSDMQQL